MIVKYLLAIKCNIQEKPVIFFVTVQRASQEENVFHKKNKKTDLHFDYQALRLGFSYYQLTE